jgi:hypothetical protein
MRFILMLCTLLFSHQLYADVFVCKDDEQTSYQDTPCAHSTKTVFMLKTPPPPSREEQLQYQQRIDRSNAIYQQKIIAEQQERLEQEKREIELEKLAIEKRKVELLEREAAASQAAAPQLVSYPSWFVVYPGFRQGLYRHEHRYEHSRELNKPSNWGTKDAAHWNPNNEPRNGSNRWIRN